MKFIALSSLLAIFGIDAIALIAQDASGAPSWGGLVIQGGALGLLAVLVAYVGPKREKETTESAEKVQFDTNATIKAIAADANKTLNESLAKQRENSDATLDKVVKRFEEHDQSNREVAETLKSAIYRAGEKCDARWARQEG